MRRSLTAITLLIALAVLMTAVPASARSDIALGVSEPRGTVEANVAKHIELYGRKPAMYSIWSSWGARGGKGTCTDGFGSCYFPKDDVNWLLAQNITPVIWWQYTNPDNETAWKWQAYDAILKGKHDKYIRQWATELRRASVANNRKPIIVRPFHEATGKWFPWSTSSLSNTVKKYKKAWLRVDKLFRQRNARQFTKFLWSNYAPRKKAYPGNRVVDYVGFTVLNYGKVKNNWRTMQSIVDSHMRAAKSFTSKPVIIAEVASFHKPLWKSKAKWLKSGYLSAYRKHPKVKGILYLDTQFAKGDGNPDWRLSKPSDGSAERAYRALVNKAKFQGRIPR